MCLQWLQNPLEKNLFSLPKTLYLFLSPDLIL